MFLDAGSTPATSTTKRNQKGEIKINNCIKNIEKLEQSIIDFPLTDNVFREPTEKEVSDFLKEAKQKDFEDIWDIFMKNVKFVKNLTFNTKQHYYKDYTNVKNICETLLSDLDSDESFPAELFKTYENKILLANTAALLAVFISLGGEEFDIEDFWEMQKKGLA